MSIMKNSCGSTDYEYDDLPYDKGYDYFLIFILFLILWWYVFKID